MHGWRIYSLKSNPIDFWETFHSNFIYCQSFFQKPCMMYCGGRRLTCDLNGGLKSDKPPNSRINYGYLLWDNRWRKLKLIALAKKLLTIIDYTVFGWIIFLQNIFDYFRWLNLISTFVTFWNFCNTHFMLFYS